MELTNEQIKSLTPEEIVRIEEDESAAEEILASKNKDTKDNTPKQEEQDAANGKGEDDKVDDDEKDKDEKPEDEDKDEPVVLNKSGKGAIPYSKHKELRVENATLKDRLQEYEAKLQELDQLKALVQEKKDAKGDVKATAEINDIIKKRIEAVREDFPDLGELVTSIVEDSSKSKAETAEIKAEFSELKAEIKRRDEEKKRLEEEKKRTDEQAIVEQVAEAKDNNPDLSFWETNDKEAFDEAVRQDYVLRQTDKWGKASIPERFEEVVRRVRTLMPEAAQPKTTKTGEKIQAEAKAKLEKSPVRKPTTLSDIKGGADPVSEKDAMENLSGPQLTAKLLQMPEQKGAAMRAGLD